MHFIYKGDCFVYLGNKQEAENNEMQTAYTHHSVYEIRAGEFDLLQLRVEIHE